MKRIYYHWLVLVTVCLGLSTLAQAAGVKNETPREMEVQQYAIGGSGDRWTVASNMRECRDYNSWSGAYSVTIVNRKSSESYEKLCEWIMQNNGSRFVIKGNWCTTCPPNQPCDCVWATACSHE